MKRLIALIAAILLFAAPALAQTLQPIDQSAKDPKLAELIATLIKACDERNFKPFEAALSTDVISSFGGDGGVQEFKDTHDIGNPKTAFYADFKKTVTMGGTFMDSKVYGTTYSAPYVYAIWPDDLDSFTWVAAIGDNTMLYEKPQGGAKTLGNVTHQILELIEETPNSKGTAPKGWAHVKAGKKTGYVKSAEIRSPVDYRAVFQKVKGRWQLHAFVAGD